MFYAARKKNIYRIIKKIDCVWKRYTRPHKIAQKKKIEKKKYIWKRYTSEPNLANNQIVCAVFAWMRINKYIYIYLRFGAGRQAPLLSSPLLSSPLIQHRNTEHNLYFLFFFFLRIKNFDLSQIWSASFTDWENKENNRLFFQSFKLQMAKNDRDALLPASQDTSSAG